MSYVITPSHHPLTPQDPEFFFWLRHARRSEEPVVVLDAGWGRVAIPLGQQMILVMAVEEDEALWREGMRQSQAGGADVRWQVGKSEAFELASRAGMVAWAGEGLSRFLTVGAQKAALRHIHQALQIGGKLAFALPLPNRKALAEAEAHEHPPLRQQTSQIDPDTGHICYIWEALQYDWMAQVVATHRIYELANDEGVMLRRWHENKTRAYFWPREVRLLLENTGFDIEASYGGWNDEPLTKASSIQVWVARKGV